MKISYNWMREYVAFDWSPKELGERLTMAGLTVEHIEEVGDDFRLHLETTNNRPDWHGFLGIAREIAALTGQFVYPPEVDLSEEGPDINSLTSVQVQDQTRCPRYIARVIQGVNVGPSPDWLRQKLDSIGVAGVNNIVDVTNFVMYETCQPLHAFDFDKLAGRRIIVRPAQAGEKMKAINQRDYALQSRNLVIADAERPVAIAGVMGGFDSEISNGTKNVLLEIAAFDTVSIRRTSRELNLLSDSSARFERGVDIERMKWVADRAASLIQQVAGGSIARDAVDINAHKCKTRAVELTFSGLRKSLGIEIGVQRIERILLGLGFEIVETLKSGFRVQIPSSRIDVKEEVDLIEEVGRVHGFHNIPDKLSLPIRVSRQEKTQSVERELHQRLVGQGFFEVLTDSFVAKDTEAYDDFWSAQDSFRVRNPMNTEAPRLRRSLLPSLLQIKLNNQNRGNERIRIYEAASAYLREGNHSNEKRVLSLLMDDEFGVLKGVVEEIFAFTGLGKVKTSAFNHKAFRVAAKFEHEGSAIGFIGEVHSALAAKFDLKTKPVWAEMDLGYLLSRLSPEKTFSEQVRLPLSKRDLAVVVDESLPWQDLEENILALNIAELRRIEFFDLYRGKQIPQGKKSLAFSLTYQAADRTLTHEEVEAYQKQVIDMMAKKFGAELRG